MRSEIEKRWDEFRHDDTDAELHWTHNAHKVLEWFLRLSFGTPRSEEIFERYYADLGIKLEGIPARYATTDWMTGAPENLRRLHMYKKLANLRAYALYGLPVENLNDEFDSPGIPESENARGDYIQTLVDTFFPDEDWIDPVWLFGSSIRPVVDAASARRKLDFGGDDEKLTLHEIAGIAQMSLKSVRNAASPKSSDPLKTDAEGCVTKAEAYRWLIDRRDFRDSVWRTSGSSHPGASMAEGIREIGPVAFVPVSRDGDFFTPAHHRKGSYRVGPPTSPEKCDTFNEALEALQRMEEPRWHKPTADGGWSILTGVQWRRIARHELESVQAEAKEASHA